MSSLCDSSWPASLAWFSARSSSIWVSSASMAHSWASCRARRGIRSTKWKCPRCGRFLNY
jgi:hypothetical protein